MRKLFHAVRFHYQLLTRRFVVRVLDGADISDALALRARIFGDELRRAGRGTAVSPGDVDPLDAHSVHLGCFDTRTDHLIGAMRLTPAAVCMDKADYVREYCLDRLDAAIIPHTTIPSRLAVDPAYRRSPAALLLVCAAYRHSTDVAKDWLALITAEPGLYQMYLRLGWRTWGHCFNSGLGGYRVPMYVVNHDYAHLRTMRSPFYAEARRIGLPHETRGREWMAAHGFDQPIDPGLRLVDPARWREYTCALFADLSPQACRELLRGAAHIHAQPGDCVIAQGDGGEQPGFLLRGHLDVMHGRRTLATIHEGQAFGEFATIKRMPRTANVMVAEPHTEIVLFRRHAFDDLSSPRDQARLWKNIARSLVNTLLAQSRVDRRLEADLEVVDGDDAGVGC